MADDRGQRKKAVEVFIFCHLFSVICPLPLAFGERVTAYLLYNGSASSSVQQA